jgi:hypothetical protein
VDVTGRGQAGHLADGIHRCPVLFQPAVVAQDIPFLVFGALYDAEDAPGDVVVDRCGLAGPPDEGGDGE